MNMLEPVLEKVGRVLADQFGIRVRCEGQRCCTDGRTIFLPALPDDIPDELRDTIRGFLDHEIGHVAGASSFPIGNEFKRKHGAEAFGFLNCLEDLRIEQFMRRRYPGSAVNLMHAYRYAVKAAAKNAESGEAFHPMKSIAFAIGSRAMNEADLPFVDPEAYRVADRIDREIRQAAIAPNTKAVAKLAESAWAEVKAYLERAATAIPVNGRKPPDDDTDVSPPSPAGASAGSPSGALPPPKFRRRRNKSGTPANAPPSSAPAGNAGKSATVPAGNNSSSVGVGGIISSLAGDIAAAVARHAEGGSIYRAWTTIHDKVSEMADNSVIPHADRMAPLMGHVAGVRQRLLQTLMAETRTRWLPDQENGRLNPRVLHRLAAAQAVRRPRSTAESSTAVAQHSMAEPGTATSQHGMAEPSTAVARHNPVVDALTRRMFRRKVVAKRVKTAVTLLVDLSHSMEGRKLDIARNASLVLCEALSRLNIPVAVWGFSAAHPGKHLKDAAVSTGTDADELEKTFRFAPLIHEVYKKFDEPFRKISGRFESMRTHCLTPLGESMLFAARELAKRPEPRKVLLVLTDGRPSVSLGDDEITFRHAKATVARIEKAGIDVALVGIMENCVRDLHHRAVVVDTLDSLPGAVMAQLQKMLSRNTGTTYRNTHAAA